LHGKKESYTPPAPAPSAENMKEDSKARILKIQEEAFQTLHEIATNSHSSPVHTTSHNLGTKLLSKGEVNQPFQYLFEVQNKISLITNKKNQYKLFLQ
jgi:hypothetical protein